MNVLVTAGPTREYIDTVRFITNASSGRMGYACAAAARAAGHAVTLITGPVCLAPPPGVAVVPIVTVEELQAALHARIAAADALIMAAAVGDFSVQPRGARKLPRAGGPVTITLVPTPDLLAGLGTRKRPGQVFIGFAVEDADPSEAAGAPAAAVAKARRELAAKNCDYLVLNTPAAMAAQASAACILAPAGFALPWVRRPKEELAAAIVRLLDQPRRPG